MKFYLSEREERAKFLQFVNNLVEKRGVVELKEVKYTRTGQQNRYLHTLLSYLALNIGEQTDYVKQVIWKQIICPEIFKTEYINTKTGEKREDWRSSADLDTKEMSDAVEKLKNWAAMELNIVLPDAHQDSELLKMDREVENNRRFL